MELRNSNKKIYEEIIAQVKNHGEGKLLRATVFGWV